MSLEDRVERLETEVAFLKEKSREHDQKLDDILALSVGLHTDLAALERKVDRGFAAIDRRFALLEERFERRCEQMDKRFEQMDKRLEQMDKRFDELPAVIARIVSEALRAQGGT